MSQSKDHLLSSYDYELDTRQIAQTPLEPRHSARLLIVENANGNLAASRHVKVWDLQEELRNGDLLVLNDTRVIKARLKVRRSGGGGAGGAASYMNLFSKAGLGKHFRRTIFEPIRAPAGFRADFWSSPGTP